VRRHDAAHRLVLHVLELREQHRLRVMETPANLTACDGESDHSSAMRATTGGEPARS
jgi:hypothetical protein